jgi:hypothetical protein
MAKIDKGQQEIGAMASQGPHHINSESDRSATIDKDLLGWITRQ